jgi:hypothetical protein
LSPWALAALPLTLAPWLLHRWSLSKAKPYPFPTLELLRAALRASYASSVLSHRVLLLLRTLLALALVFLASRPVLRWGRGAGGGGPLTTVLLVDVSASMGARVAGRTRLEWAVQEAAAFCPTGPAGSGAGERPAAGSSERVGLVAYSDRVELALPPASDGARVFDALRSLSLTDRPTRLEAALEAAIPWLNDRGGRATLVFTDAARNGWRGLKFTPPDGVRLAVARGPVLESNAGVTGVRLAADASGGGRLEAMGWGKSAPGAKGWTLSWDGRPASQGRIVIGLGPSSAVLPVASVAALARGEASLDPDGFPADDVFYLLPPPEARVGVLVVDGSPALSPAADEVYFLTPVLEGLARAGGRFKIVLPEALAREPLKGWNVLMLANVGDLPPGAAERIRSFVEEGGGFWATAGDRFSPGALAALLPVRPTGRIADGERVSLSPEASRNPLGRRLAEEGGFDWAKIEARRLFEAVPGPDSTVLLAGASGKPFLSVGRIGRGRTAFLATTIDRDWTNLPARPAFPVLCRGLWSFLAGGTEETSSSLTVDSPWEGPLAAGSADVLVERPDGGKETPDVRGGRFRFAKTDRAGFYTLSPRAGGQPIARAAVNLDASSGESDPTPLTASEAKKALGVSDLAWIESPAPVRARFDELVRGRPMAGPLALFIGLLLAGETLLLGFLRK